jgi:hypothetical protein
MSPVPGLLFGSGVKAKDARRLMAVLGWEEGLRKHGMITMRPGETCPGQGKVRIPENNETCVPDDILRNIAKVLATAFNVPIGIQDIKRAIPGLKNLEKQTRRSRVLG